MKPETLREARKADRITARLAALATGVQDRAAADAKIAKAVAGLRRDGVGWPRIAAELGVTRQAARKRFGEPKLSAQTDVQTPTLFEVDAS